MDLDDLARGAAILGSGGGGAPSYNLELTRQMIEAYGAPQIVSFDELKDDDLVVPIAFMGAPLAALEKIPSGEEFKAIFRALPKGKRVVLVPAEIGGANAFTPLWIGAMMGLPVLDGDTIGRAFPELQMSVCTLHGVSASPAYIADALGNLVKVEARDSHSIERIARQVAVSMGARALVAIYLMEGNLAKKVCIEGSISKAIELGKKRDFTPLFSGTVIDVDRKIENGFLKGRAKIENGFLKGSAKIQGDRILELYYQNEYLLAKTDKVIAETPDIIMLLEQESQIPITSSSLSYGLRVDLISFKAPSIWKSPEGLALAGMEYFRGRL